jgi:hypothetical protein
LGANETILVKFNCFNSRDCTKNSSFLWIFFLINYNYNCSVVITIIAFEFFRSIHNYSSITSDISRGEFGIASLMTTIITPPIWAYHLLLVPLIWITWILKVRDYLLHSNGSKNWSLFFLNLSFQWKGTYIYILFV